MKELKFKQFGIDEVDEITLLSVEEAKKVQPQIRACSEWWWLRSPGLNQYFAAIVDKSGISELGDLVSSGYHTIRPVFKINSLESEIGEKIMVNKTWCTIIDEGLVLADNPICNHRFDEKSNKWETSELKAFINSEEFKSMI